VKLGCQSSLEILEQNMLLWPEPSDSRLRTAVMTVTSRYLCCLAYGQPPIEPVSYLVSTLKEEAMSYSTLLLIALFSISEQVIKLYNILATWNQSGHPVHSTVTVHFKQGD
jgi:hypothetical protein